MPSLQEAEPQQVRPNQARTWRGGAWAQAKGDLCGQEDSRQRAETATRRADPRAARSVPGPGARQLLRQVSDHRLGVAEEHEGLVEEVELVVDAGEAGVLAALDGEDGARAVGL